MPTIVSSGSGKVLPLMPIGNAVTVPAPAEGLLKALEMRPSGRVIIEIVGVCQAKCPYCAQNSGKSRRKEKPQAYMPVQMFRAIISQLAKSEAFVSRKIDRVYLYNWGEPFLAPAFNEYLEILREHGLYAVVSSNFQKVPVILKENLPVINEVILSLSGMTQGTYGRIHGGDIKEVLANFETFNADMKRYVPNARTFMSWHRYTFNEHEFWDAYRYSRRHGIGFLPTIAFLNDLTEMIQAGTDRLPEERKARAKIDLFFDHMLGTLDLYRNNGALYDCPAWDDVVIDEQGRLLICCGTDSQTAVGRVFETTYDEMREKKIRSGFCRVCKHTGVAEWSRNLHHDRNQLPWPAGGGVDFLRLKLLFNRHKLKIDARLALDKLPFGEAVLGIYRKLKYV